MKSYLGLNNVHAAIDDYSERIGIKLENGSILFITKKRQEMK